MPNLDSTGKFGRSMDCSQIIFFKKSYAVLQQQNGKIPPGDQRQKPAFNSDRLNGGDSKNGASSYYNQKGSSLFFKRFFGTNTGNTSPNSLIDPRFSQYAAFIDLVARSLGRVLSIVIDSLTDTTISTSFTFLFNSGVTDIERALDEPYTKFTGDGVLPGGDSVYLYLNASTSPITVTTSRGFTRIYSPGQFFTNDSYSQNMYSIDPRFSEFTTFSNSFAAPNDIVVSLIAETTPTQFSFTTLTKSLISNAVPFTEYTTFNSGSTIPATLGFGWYFNNTGGSITFNTSAGYLRRYSNNQFFAGDGFLATMNIIDSRFSEYVAFFNLHSPPPGILSWIIDDSQTDATEFNFTYRISISPGNIVSLPPTTVPYTTLTTDSTLTDPGSWYRNTGTGPILVTTSDGFTRTYSLGQFFSDDSINENM